MGTQGLCEFGVAPCDAPSVELDRAVAQLEALVSDVEVLIDRGERHGGRVGRDLLSERSPEQLVGRHAERLAGNVKQGYVDQAENVDRELLDAVQFPHA